MEVYIEKCVILVLKKGEKTNHGRNTTTKLGNYGNTWRKRELQILGNFGSGHYQTEMKVKVKKEYLRTRMLLKTKLYSRNLIKEIPYLKLTREELRQID